MKERHTLYKGIIIYHDSDLAQYSFTYKHHHYKSDNIKKLKDTIDLLLSSESMRK